MTRDRLLNLSPAIIRFADALVETMHQYDISTKERQSCFLAQVAHESAAFTRTVENLNYSAESLLRVFQKYFHSETEARQYHRQPERIANRVYGNRLGNGDEDSGDGWRFRGRGLIQVTGRENYRVCSVALYADERLLTTPELLEQPAGACHSAGWFWQSRRLNDLADAGRFEDITRRINGGLTGVEDRRRWLEKARALLLGPQPAARTAEGET